MCGPHSCPARAFALMPSLLGLEVSPHAQAVLDIMPRYRSSTWWTSGRDLHSLLQKFKDSKTLMPRDKVYALLGMSEDACDPKRFYPCYEKEDGRVFQNAACFLIFGEVAAYNHGLPSFKLEDLYSQRFVQIFKAFTFAITGFHTSERRRKLLDLIFDRLNEGRLGSSHWLVLFANRFGSVAEERVRDILSCGAVAIRRSLGGYSAEDGYHVANDILTIFLKEDAKMSISLDVTRMARQRMGPSSARWLPISRRVTPVTRSMMMETKWTRPFIIPPTEPCFRTKKPWMQAWPDEMERGWRSSHVIWG